MADRSAWASLGIQIFISERGGGEDVKNICWFTPNYHKINKLIH